MKAVILAGGQGTRLRPVTYEIPKPLVPVKKKPILNHLIHFFLKHGISEVGVLAARAHEDDFRRWRKAWDDDLPHGKVSIFYEEKPRGTFGGFEQLREWLGEGPFIVTNGDDLKEFNLKDLIDFHHMHKPIGTLMLVEVPNPQDKGVPVREGHRITEFLEKPARPPSNFISGGLYVLEPAIFDHVDFSKDTVMIEHDVFPKLAAIGQLTGLEMRDIRWYDCGTLENWEKAIREW